MRYLFVLFLFLLLFSKQILAYDLLPDDAMFDFNTQYEFDIEPTHLYYNTSTDYRVVSKKGRCLEVFNSSVKFSGCQSTEAKQFWYVIILEQNNGLIKFKLFNQEKNIYLGYDSKKFKKIKSSKKNLAYLFTVKTSVKNKSDNRERKKIYCKNLNNSNSLLELDSLYGCPGWGAGVSNEYTQISKAEYDNKNQKNTASNKNENIKYCKQENGNIYSYRNLNNCRKGTKIVSKAEYDKWVKDGRKIKKTIQKKSSASLNEKGYADCILENMKNISSDEAALAIKEACTYKYLSENTNSNVVSSSADNTSAYSDNTIGIVSLPSNLSSCGSITTTRFPIFTGC